MIDFGSLQYTWFCFEEPRYVLPNGEADPRGYRIVVCAVMYNPKTDRWWARRLDYDG